MAEIKSIYNNDINNQTCRTTLTSMVGDLSTPPIVRSINYTNSTDLKNLEQGVYIISCNTTAGGISWDLPTSIMAGLLLVFKYTTPGPHDHDWLKQVMIGEDGNIYIRYTSAIGDILDPSDLGDWILVNNISN